MLEKVKNACIIIHEMFHYFLSCNPPSALLFKGCGPEPARLLGEGATLALQSDAEDLELGDHTGAERPRVRPLSRVQQCLCLPVQTRARASVFASVVRGRCVAKACWL